jgi:type VI secretion system protein ImpA
MATTDTDRRKAAEAEQKRVKSAAEAEQAVQEEREQMQADLAKWSAPVSSDAPAGDNLAYDPEYKALFAKAKGKAADAFTKAPAEEANWSQVRSSCIALLARTKDLPVAVLFTFAQLKTAGLAGLVSGLELIRILVDEYWDTLYPRPEEDERDPTLLDHLERVNILKSLSPPPETYGDPYRFRILTRELPLVASPLHGKASLKDAEAAAASGSAADAAAVDAAFDEAPTARLGYVGELAAAGAAACLAIKESVTARCGDRGGELDDILPSLLDDLRETLAEISTVIARQLARRGPVLSDAPPSQPDGATGPAPGGSAPGRAAPGVPGAIRSRQDVVECLARLCDYYAAYEPSSPIPLLLQRASRLVSKSFIEIIRDLSPDAMAQLTVISGVPDEPVAQE